MASIGGIIDSVWTPVRFAIGTTSWKKGDGIGTTAPHNWIPGRKGWGMQTRKVGADTYYRHSSAYTNQRALLLGAAAAGGGAYAAYEFWLKPKQDKQVTDTGNQRYNAGITDGKDAKGKELQPQLDQLKKDKQTQDNTISDLTRRLDALQNRVGGNTPAAIRPAA